MKFSFLNRYILSPEKIQHNKSLRFLGDAVNKPNLWHLNRHSVARAFAIGLFWAMIPMPMQMLAAACIAIPLRANLPLSIGLVWITNPVTTPPVFYGNYKLGAWLLETPAIQMPDSMSIAWFFDIAASHWQPLYFGSLITGVLLAIVGYFAVKYYWQWKVGRIWLKRKRERALRNGNR